MTVEEFRARTIEPRETNTRIAMLPPRRERLAIVSTRNKLCGIAAYTQALERQLADLFDVTVFDLDQYLLRARHPRVRVLGDRHIKDICRDIASFDAVSLQIEFGTLGEPAKDIARRFQWLVSAAPRLSVTFHSLHRPPRFPIGEVLRSIATFKWLKTVEIVLAFFHKHRLSVGIAKILREAQRRKPVSVIVHNRRNHSDAKYLHGFDNVADHPLSFLSAREAEVVLAHASRGQFAQLDRLPQDIKLIGVFGFLSDYKGFEVVIRALRHLGENHHLLIFGGVHPSEIRQNSAIHQYSAILLDEAHVDASMYEEMHATPSIGLNIDIERHLATLFGKHPRDLSDRVHFMGALDDADFLAGMAICDVVVLPYLEVGQSASGPISQAVELGCRVIASRTHTFLEFARYHPDTVEFFDIGNHLELAERIAARRLHASRRERLCYTVETNKAVYLAANSSPVGAETYFAVRGTARQRPEIAR